MADGYPELEHAKKADGGIRTIPINDSKSEDSENLCAGSVQSETFFAENEPDLALLNEAWPILPEHIKAAIIALIHAFVRDDRA